MRHSEFWQAMERAFGPTYARSVAADQVIGAIGGRTPAQALEEGEAPRQVWDAVCDAMELPDAVRWSYRDEARRRR